MFSKLCIKILNYLSGHFKEGLQQTGKQFYNVYSRLVVEFGLRDKPEDMYYADETGYQNSLWQTQLWQ